MYGVLICERDKKNNEICQIILGLANSTAALRVSTEPKEHVIQKFLNYVRGGIFYTDNLDSWSTVFIKYLLDNNIKFEWLHFDYKTYFIRIYHQSKFIEIRCFYKLLPYHQKELVIGLLSTKVISKTKEQAL